MNQADAKGLVMILGARSDLGRALAHEYARGGHEIYLAARQSHRLKSDASDLSIRYGVAVSIYEFDVLAIDQHVEFIQSLPTLPDTVICVIGLMVDQKTAERNCDAAREVMLTNYVGPAVLLGKFAEAMEQRGFGSIIGVSSIAGDRGRPSNYIYGSSKAGLSVFLEGLRTRCSAKGCEVMTIKPGFVKTRMTEHLAIPEFLLIGPDRLARKIRRLQMRKVAIGYSNLFWRVVSLGLRILPDTIIRRLP